MEHLCNLECWCHVPTRGIINPLCYLCVLQTCSLSTKSDTVPSAPPLNPDDDETPETPERASHTVADAAYGWRLTLTRMARNTNPEDEWRNPNLLVTLPPEEGEEGATGGGSVAAPHDALPPEPQHSTSTPTVPQVMEGCTPDSATEYTRRRPCYEGDAQPLPAEPQRILSRVLHVNEVTVYETQEVHATSAYVVDYDDDDDDERHAHQKRQRSHKRDLEDSIKHLKLKDEDSRANSSNTNQQSCEPRSSRREVTKPKGRNWLMANVYWEKKKKSTGVSSGPHAVHMDRNRVSPRSTSLTNLPSQELEYKRINKIHRRESSAAACQRYQDENSRPRRSQGRWRRLIALPSDTPGSGTGAIPRNREDPEAYLKEKNVKYEERWQSLHRKLSGANHKYNMNT